MRANNTLTHTPTPDMACYSLAGAQGAPSNLSLGASGAKAIGGFIDDTATRTPASVIAAGC